MLLMKLVWSKDSAKMPTIVPRAPKPMTSSRTATTSRSGCSTGAPVIGTATRGERAADEQGAEGAADQVAEVHLPGVHRGGEDVVDEAVAAALVDRAGVVGVGGLGHRHRDQAGDDEDLVVEALDLVDAAAEREAEDDDEEQGGDDRRQRRLGPELEDAVALAAAEPVEAAPGADAAAVGRRVPTLTPSPPRAAAARRRSSGRPARGCRRRSGPSGPAAVSRATILPPPISAISSQSSSASSR